VQFFDDLTAAWAQLFTASDAVLGLAAPMGRAGGYRALLKDQLRPWESSLNRIVRSQYSPADPAKGCVRLRKGVGGVWAEREMSMHVALVCEGVLCARQWRGWVGVGVGGWSARAGTKLVHVDGSRAHPRPRVNNDHLISYGSLSPPPPPLSPPPPTAVPSVVC
jgi:hypothetical protein